MTHRMTAPRTGIRLAADIGGTFTDVVLETPARRYSCKVPTTTRQPELAVLEGIEQLLETSGVHPTEVELFIHGTTLATNALIERKGARTGLLTTAGFRDVLEMGFEKRFEHYDIDIERPTGTGAAAAAADGVPSGSPPTARSCWRSTRPRSRRRPAMREGGRCRGGRDRLPARVRLAGARAPRPRDRAPTSSARA